MKIRSGWRRRGAGLTEYVILLALALGIFLGIFWSSLVGPLEDRLNEAGFSVKLRKKKTDPAGSRKGDGSGSAASTDNQNSFEEGNDADTSSSEESERVTPRVVFSPSTGTASGR